MTNGATFSSIISTSPLFPLYPGTIVFDQYDNITYAGTPVAMWSPGSLGGIGTSGVTLEAAAPLLVQQAGYRDARDINRDGFIDTKDLAIFVQEWLAFDFGLEGDINGDNIVNMFDLANFVSSQSIPLNLSQLFVLQIDLNGAATSTLSIVPESTYRGGVVQNDGTAFSAIPVSLIIPEPMTILLLSLGAMVLRKKIG